MVVIRRVPSRLEESVTVPIPAPPRRKVEESPAADDDIVPAPAVPLPAMVAADVVDERPREPSARYRIHHHRMLLGVPVLAAIFAAGAWLGDWVGGGSSADASTVTTTVHLQANVIRLPGRVVKLQVPGQTVKVKGRVVTIPGKTVVLHKRIVTTDVSTLHDTTTVPTTITSVVTVPPTDTVTTTSSSTVTVTSTVPVTTDTTGSTTSTAAAT